MPKAPKKVVPTFSVKEMEKVRMPRVPKKVIPTFSEKEIERLLSQPDKHSNEGFRDYAIMAVMLDSAIRVSEIVSLKLSDVDLENGYLRIMGKGNKERYVPFGQKVAKVLKALGGMAELKVNGTKDPILFTVDGYRVMVMPMFVQWGDEAEAPTEGKPRRSRKAKEPVVVEA